MEDLLRRGLILLAGVFCLGFLSGCATIVSDSDYLVNISSEPDDVSIVIKDKFGRVLQKGKTPMPVQLQADAGYFKRAKYTIQFAKNGYYSQNYVLRADLDPWYIGNFLFGGLIGFLLVDPMTGDMWELDEAVHVCMVRDEKIKLEDPLPVKSQIIAQDIKDQKLQSNHIVTKLKELKALKDQGIITEEEYEQQRKMLVTRLYQSNCASVDNDKK